MLLLKISVIVYQLLVALEKFFITSFYLLKFAITVVSEIRHFRFHCSVSKHNMTFSEKKNIFIKSISYKKNHLRKNFLENAGPI